MSDRSVTRAEIIRLALPALGSLAADPVVTLVDTAFVGRLGTDALAALGVSAAITGLAFVAFNFLQYAVAPMVGRLVGGGRGEEAADVARHALVIAVGLGVVVSALTAVGAPWLVGLMAAPPEAVDGAVTYLRIRAWAAPALMVIMVANGTFRGHQDTVTPLRLTLVLNLVNLVLDPVLIFGAGWGIAGAATATVIAQVTGAVLFLRAMTTRRHLVRGPVSATGLRPFVRVGWELAVRTGSLVLTFTVAARVAASLGAVAIAAHQVANQIWLLLALAVDSLAIAAQAMVSFRLGRGDTIGVGVVARSLVRWGLGVGAGLTVLVLAMIPVLPGWFSTDPEVLATLRELLVWVAVLQVPGALVFVWDGLYMGASRFGYLAVATSAASVVGLGLLALVGPAGWGVGGVWAAISVFVLARLVTLVGGQRAGRFV